MLLSERETQLAELRRALDQARDGRGVTTIVTGEAGIGKTSLVEYFAVHASQEALILTGACEALFSPRPLGPFHDIVNALGGQLLAQLKASAKPIDLFHGLLGALKKQSRPTVIIVEDAHWADHATLDFIRFVGRRISKLPAVLIVTYRDDEVGADHPLVFMLAELPPDSRVRIKLPGLSREAVEQLSNQSARHLPDLFRLTGGNPFFVTEALRAPTDAIAPNVREAVLARARNLGPAARGVLDLVCVVPDRVELSLLEQLLGHDLAGLEQCMERGLLRLEGDFVCFRHEIARLAFEDGLLPGKRAGLHRKVLGALTKLGSDANTVTRLAHHAIAARDPSYVLRYAPAAARAARERSAHRESAHLLKAAIPYVGALGLRERAEFHESRMHAHFLVGEHAEGIRASVAAYELWALAGDDYARGRNIVRRFAFPWAVREANAREQSPAGDHCAPQPVLEEASRVGHMRTLANVAIELLNRFPPSLDLALAHATLATLPTVDDLTTAVHHWRQARALADLPGDAEEVAEVLARIVLAELVCFGGATADSLQRLMHHSRAAGVDRRVVTAFAFDALRAIGCGDLAYAERAVRNGLTFAEDRELGDFQQTHLLHWSNAALSAARGDWRTAQTPSQYEVAGKRPGVSPLMAAILLLNRALLASRQGLPVKEDWLRTAFTPHTEVLLHDVFRRHRAYAEMAWLAGDMAAARGSADIAWRIAEKWRHPWICGEVLLLRRLIGEDDDSQTTVEVAPPYAALFGGDWRGSAQQWRAIGQPYHEALALILGSEEGLRQGFGLLDALGATAVAHRIREQLRERGRRNVPRGPIARTKGNPGRLTERELEVLGCLAEGLSNSQIASRLHRSVRTVDHHVAAVIEKLGANGRLHAVALARERKMLAGP